MINRDFTYKGIKFHLNDNIGTEVRYWEGKYKLLFWHEGYERWQQICTVNTKKEAMEYVRREGYDRIR